MSAGSGSISVTLPGPGSAAFIGAGLAALGAAYAAAHGGFGFLIGAALVGATVYLAWIGKWIEDHPRK